MPLYFTSPCVYLSKPLPSHDISPNISIPIFQLLVLSLVTSSVVFKYLTLLLVWNSLEDPEEPLKHHNLGGNPPQSVNFSPIPIIQVDGVFIIDMELPRESQRGCISFLLWEVLQNKPFILAQPDVEKQLAFLTYFTSCYCFSTLFP